MGRVFSRRDALILLGGAVGLAVASGGVAAATSADRAAAAPRGGLTAATVDCVAKPEMTEGPFFVDEGLNRSDVRFDTSTGETVHGIPLNLELTILSVAAGVCVPLPGAVVDIWSCTVEGVYSDVDSQNSSGSDYLRGYQITRADGSVGFLTVLPGWYIGRTIHIHVKVQTTGADGNAYEFTSQLYFPEDFSAAYLATEPYASRGPADTVNSTDRFYADVGDQMVTKPVRTGDGYTATFSIGLDLTDAAVGADDHFEFPPGGPGGGPSATPGAPATRTGAGGRAPKLRSDG